MAETIEIIKAAALVLAIFIPLVIAVFAYRREERKQEKLNATPPQLLAIGGAIATKEEGLQHTEALNNLSDSIQELNERIDDIVRRGDRRADLMEKGVDALKNMCHLLGDIEQQMKRSRP